MKYFITIFLTLFLITQAKAFNLFLNNGTFYGPGDAIYQDTGVSGETIFTDAQVRNIVLTGPLTGNIPFFNNGASQPNVIAERLQKGGVIDGAASDGTLINENADTGLRLNFKDPDTGEFADVMVVAEYSKETEDGSEPIFPDKNGNLTFNPSVLADPGNPSLISRFSVSFTTGIAEVPLSLKTINKQAGGKDFAGPLASGYSLVGRLGDHDQDGFLDGVLVLADNAPLDLIVGRGNPIAQYRPWSSDVPIDPITASLLTLNGIVRNNSQVISKNFSQFQFSETINNFYEVNYLVDAVLRNFRVAINNSELKPNQVSKLRIIRKIIKQNSYGFRYLTVALENIEFDKSISPDELSGRLSFIKNKLNYLFNSTASALNELSKGLSTNE